MGGDVFDPIIDFEDAIENPIFEPQVKARDAQRKAADANRAAQAKADAQAAELAHQNLLKRQALSQERINLIHSAGTGDWVTQSLAPNTKADPANPTGG